MKKEVEDGIRAVRDSGLANMTNRWEVAAVASKLGHYHTATWIQDHQSKEYVKLLMTMKF